MQGRPQGWGWGGGGWWGSLAASYMATLFKARGHTDGQQTSRQGQEQGQGTRMTDCNGQPLDTEAVRRQKKKREEGGEEDQMMRKRLVFLSRLSWLVWFWYSGRPYLRRASGREALIGDRRGGRLVGWGPSLGAVLWEGMWTST